VHAHELETVYVVPILSDSLHYPPGGKRRIYRSRSGGMDCKPQLVEDLSVASRCALLPTMTVFSIVTRRATLPG